MGLCFSVAQYFWSGVFEHWHRSAYACADVCRITDDLPAVAYVYIVARSVAVESDCSSDMVWIVEQNDIESEQILYQITVQNRAVLAVAVRIVEQFFDKKRFFKAELFVVCGIFETGLYEIKQDSSGFPLAFAGNRRTESIEYG